MERDAYDIEELGSMKWIIIGLIIGMIVMNSVKADPFDDWMKGVEESFNNFGNIECLVKTGDNVPSNEDRRNWSPSLTWEDKSASYKQGYIVSCKPAGSEWGTLEKDPKRFMIVSFNSSDFNPEWLEPEYGEQTCRNETGSPIKCPKGTPEYDKEMNITILRKYVLPLSSVLSPKEIDDIKNIPYNQKVDWTLFKTVENIGNKVVLNDYEHRPEEIRTHGSSGQFFICPSGCDYTSLVNWQTGEAGDIRVGGPCIATINESFTEYTTARFDINGWTNNATSRIIINVTDNARHEGFFNASKYMMLLAPPSDYVDAMWISENYLNISGIQIASNTTTNKYGGTTIEFQSGGGAYSRFDSIIITNLYGTKGFYSYGIYGGYYSAGAIISNCVLFNLGSSSDVSGIYEGTQSAGSHPSFFNNLAYGNKYGFAGRAAGPFSPFKNNIALKNSVGDFTGTFNVSSDYSVSSDATAPGIHNATGKTAYSTYFVNNATGDFHLTDTSLNLFGLSGEDLSANFTNDIDNDIRSNWDIGPDEYQAGGDEDAPVITTVSPTNTTYPTQTVFFNVSLNEAGGWCGLSLDGTANITMSNSSTTTWGYVNSSMTETYHNVKYYCNDTAGNMNVTAPIVYFTVQHVLAWSLNQTNSTVAGDDILHSLYWNGTFGLAGSIFSFCNGTWDGTDCLGLEEITIQLQDADTENLEDVDIFYSYMGYHTRARTLNKYNISLLSVIPIDKTIIDAKWCLYRGGFGTWDNDTTFYLVENQTWTEHDSYASLSGLTTSNQTSDSNVWPSNGWDCLNVTNMVIDEDAEGNSNISFKIEDPDQIGTTDTVSNLTSLSIGGLSSGLGSFGIYLNSKEYADTSLRPYLNITYTTGSSGAAGWLNDSYVPMTGTGNWSNVTKSVNTMVGANISWYVWANDTSGNSNQSAIFSYMTTSGGEPSCDSSHCNLCLIEGDCTTASCYWWGDECHETEEPPAQCWTEASGLILIPNGCEYPLAVGEGLI